MFEEEDFKYGTLLRQWAPSCLDIGPCEIAVGQRSKSGHKGNSSSLRKRLGWVPQLVQVSRVVQQHRSNIYPMNSMLSCQGFQGAFTIVYPHSTIDPNIHDFNIYIFFFFFEPVFLQIRVPTSKSPGDNCVASAEEFCTSQHRKLRSSEGPAILR